MTPLNQMIGNAIKIILVLLFILCLLDMSYGYYQFVRFTALLGFGLLAYFTSKKEDKTEMIVYLALAILFQPILKISLGRTIWNIVDVVVALGLIASFFTKEKSKDKNVFTTHNSPPS